jgi:hypothetical protein
MVTAISLHPLKSVMINMFIPSEEVKNREELKGQANPKVSIDRILLEEYRK